MNNRAPITPRKFLQTINVIHLALCLGVGLFLCVTFYLQKTDLYFDIADTDNVFIYVLPILTVYSFFMGRYMFNTNIKKASEESTLSSKLQFYQTGFIIKCATMEGAALFSIVVLLITGNLLFGIAAALLLTLLISFRPTKEKIKDELNLDSESQKEFDSLDEKQSNL